MGSVLVITGGIGSGKSLVSKMLCERGVPVYDCDSAAKALYGKNPSLAAMVTDDIFTNPEALEKLESSLFPLLMEDFTLWKHSHPDAEILGFESATILDKAYFDGFGDWVVYVSASPEVRFQRALSRGNITQESLMQRMALQKDHSHSKRLYRVLHNDSTVENLELQIDILLKNIKENGKGKN